MNTATPSLPVTSSDGVCITLADGRELIGGISSWWAAERGYNHPHITAAKTAQLALCRGFDNVKDVRVLGGIGVVQLHDTLGLKAVKPLRVDRGVWIRPYLDIIYLAAPMVITPQDLTPLTSVTRSGLAV